MMNHFSLKAKDWDSPEQIDRNRQYAQAILKLAPLASDQLRILDFGCGTGLLSSYFANQAQSLLGVDNTPEMLERFDHRFENVHIAQSLCVDLKLQPTALEPYTFDFVVSAMAFHHLEQPVEVLKLIQSSMCSGARFFLIDLDQEDGSFHPDPKAMGVHHFGFSFETLQEWAKRLEFKSFQSSVILTIEKNAKAYPVRLSLFEV